jgi:hypothetical protein
MWQDTVAKVPIIGLNYCDINPLVFKLETFSFSQLTMPKNSINIMSSVVMSAEWIQ